MQDSDGLVPFVGSGGWVTNSRSGQAPLIGWLVGHGHSLPDDYVRVLLRCDSAAEVRFVLPIVTLSDWCTLGETGFTNGRTTIELQESVGPFTADFVIRDAELGRPVIIEVDGPTHFTPQQLLHDADRDRYLTALGFDVRRVPAEHAQEFGFALRRDLAKAGVKNVRAATARSTAVAPQRRSWPRNPLAYNVAGLPAPTRRDLLSSWLASRNIVVSEDAQSFLAYCDEAAEVHFLLPFIDLPHATVEAGSKVLRLLPYWVFIAQDDDQGRMDVVLAWDVADGLEAIVYDIEPPPFVGFDAWAAECKRKSWRQRGFGSIRVGARRAGEEGRWWAQRVRAGIEHYERSGRVLALSGLLPYS